jgi:hypothetical protein
MGARAASREDRTLRRLNSHDLNIRVLLAQVLASAGDCTPCTHSRHEDVHLHATAALLHAGLSGIQSTFVVNLRKLWMAIISYKTWYSLRDVHTSLVPDSLRSAYGTTRQPFHCEPHLPGTSIAKNLLSAAPHGASVCKCNHSNTVLYHQT